MATKPQRAMAILNACADPATVDNAMATRIGDAFAYTYRRDEVLTAAQKSGVFIYQIRKMIKQIVADAEVSQGLETERQRLAPLSDIAIGTDEI